MALNSSKSWAFWQGYIRDGLMWTESLTEGVKLRFEILRRGEYINISKCKWCEAVYKYLRRLLDNLIHDTT